MLHRCLPFIFVLFFLVYRASFPGATSSLRSVAGLEDVLCGSCGSDVEDELVPEFDNSGTTTGTKFPSCREYSSLFGQVWLLTAGPIKSISVFFAELSK